jgi:hypothetical protein
VRNITIKNLNSSSFPDFNGQPVRNGQSVMVSPVLSVDTTQPYSPEEALNAYPDSPKGSPMPLTERIYRLVVQNQGKILRASLKDQLKDATIPDKNGILKKIETPDINRVLRQLTQRNLLIQHPRNVYITTAGWGSSHVDKPDSGDTFIYNPQRALQTIDGLPLTAQQENTYISLVKIGGIGHFKAIDTYLTESMNTTVASINTILSGLKNTYRLITRVDRGTYKTVAGWEPKDSDH